MLFESEKIKKAIERVADAEINKLTAPCYRVYKAVVVEAPNGTTCKVRLIGDDTVLTLPYAESLLAITEGTFVWVGAFYAVDNSLSNAVVWETLKFNEVNGNVTYSYAGIGAKSTNGILNVPIDLSKFRILQLTVANLDFTAGSLGAIDLFVYGGDTFLYKYGASTVGTSISLSASSSPANTCDINFGLNTIWSDNNNMNVVILYTLK